MFVPVKLKRIMIIIITKFFFLFFISHADYHAAQVSSHEADSPRGKVIGG